MFEMLIIRLVKIISDYLLQTSLSHGCNDVMKADVITLNERYPENFHCCLLLFPSCSSLLFYLEFYMID
jgi:hypothetical protein